MSCELTITIDTNGEVLTAIAGKPGDINEAYNNIEKNSLVSEILRQILEVSKKELNYALCRTEE